jgi:hypothetical protein
MTGEVPAAHATLLPTPTRLPITTADLLADEIYQGTTLRGRLVTVYTEPQADGTELRILLDLTHTSLADAQWDAYQVLKAVWTGHEFQIPADWIVHVVCYINADSQTLGTPIAVANLSAARASGFPWTQLSPEQAWGRYDGTLFNPSGL